MSSLLVSLEDFVVRKMTLNEKRARRQPVLLKDLRYVNCTEKLYPIRQKYEGQKKREDKVATEVKGNL